VEVSVSGHTEEGKSRAGFWLVGIEWQNRDLQARIRFLDEQGRVVAAEDLELARVPPL
jgi:hypothetical protein